jgi:LCP family protein required for cell wall assembly
MTRRTTERTGRVAYTGDTIVMPKQDRRRAPPPGFRRRRPRTSVWTYVKRGLLAVLALLLIAMVMVYLQIRSVAAPLVVRDMRIEQPLFSSLLSGINVLIIGVDERPDHPEEGVRSDTLIVAHMSGLGRWVNLLSLPRDSRVNLPNVGETKINYAYGYGHDNARALFGADTTPAEGGMAMAASTVEQFLNMRQSGQRIDYAVQVNFDGFARIIDALGGITIDVPTHIVDDAYPTPDFGTMRVEFQPGVQRMDGATALIYARTRHADSDFGRAARQQQVLRAIVAEMRQLGPVGLARALPKLREGLQGTVATTMPAARPDFLAGMLWLMSGVHADTIGQISLSPQLDPQMQEDGSDLIWSQEGIAAAMRALTTPPGMASEEATVQVLNGTGVGGLAGSVSLQLEKAGFTIVPADNAPTADVQKTVVYDLTGKPNTSKRLGQVLNAEVRTGPAPDGIVSQADIVVVLGQDAAK